MVLHNPLLGEGGGESEFQNTNNFCSLNEIIKNGIVVDGEIDDDFDDDFPRLNAFDPGSFDYYTLSKLNTFYTKNHIDEVKALKVVHFNIRGLQSNFDNLVLYLNSIIHPFDFICLSECHLSEQGIDITDRFNLIGYDKHVVYSSIKFGGCVIYAKSIHKTELVTPLTKTTNSCDHIYVKMPKFSGNKPLLVGCYYRFCRTSKDDVMNFINVLENNLESNIIKNNKTLIAGDFNLDLCNINKDNDVSTYFNCLLSNNLENHIMKPTRIQYYANSLQVRSATLIDHISSNLFENKCTAGNLYFSDSDHFGNFVVFENVLNCKPTKRSDIPPMRRNLAKVDHHKLVEDLNAIDWPGEVCNSYLDINTCIENMINHIKILCDRHCPLTQCSKRKLKYSNKPWIDKALLQLILLKNVIYRKKKVHPSEHNRSLFSKIRSQVNHSMRLKKKEYFINYFNNYRTNAKKTWEGLYMAMEITRHRKTLSTNIKDSTTGQIFNNPKEIANRFANYFEQVPHNVRKKLPSKVPHFTKYLPKAARNSMFFNDSTPLEVFGLINKLKNSCSTGNVDIPNQFLKLINFPLSYILSQLINRSLSSGIMPTLLKVGKQTPVFKGGDICFSNHRPITVVNSFSKIFEKITASRLTSYLDRYKILNNRQFGFRKHHSTIHAMINLLDTCLDGLNERLTVGGIFLDISKAFDSVDHSILLAKLENYGIRGIVLQWFKSYLCERELFVSVNGTSSVKYLLEYGVPQGSVLGPILFLLYINDVVASSEQFIFSMFADDTALILKIDRAQYDDCIRTELLNVMTWFDANKLLLNVDKTKYLYFGPEYNTIKALHSITPDFIYKKSLDDNYQQPENSEVKYLGVIFDNNLNFDKQIHSTAMKVSRMVGILWQCKDLPLDAKLTIYHSLVASYLNYGILIWGSQLAKNLAGRYELKHVPNHLKKLNTAHNKVIRAITRSKKYNKETRVVTHTAPLLKQLKLLSLNDVYYLQLALFAFDCLRSTNLPSLFDDYFTSREGVHSNRSSVYDLFIPRVNLDSVLSSIKIASSYMWNTLPHDIKSVNYSKNVFKSKVKSWLINQY
jgi:exonuclease III